MSLNIDYQNSFVKEEDILKYKDVIEECHNKLLEEMESEKSCAGWVEFPASITREEINNIKTQASKVRKNSDLFIIIGVGGSYLGSRAVIDALKGILLKDYDAPKIIYLGNDLSSDHLYEVLSILDEYEVSINVISKSGNTMETSLAFRFIKEYMDNRYGDSACERIIITTDEKKGLLRKVVNKFGYLSFSVPENIGGRFSVLTAVGLFPMAVAGLDIEKIISGARISQHEYEKSAIDENKSYQYAALRHILFNQGKYIEILVCYELRLEHFQQWYRQLFAESEGKDGKGIFPVGAIYTRDLHSIGQMVQDGKRNIFETTIKINRTKQCYRIPSIDDGLNISKNLEGKTLDALNHKAFKATIEAHKQGNVPNIVIEIDSLDEEHMGQLIYFFEKACAISSYLLEVNPFDQPGVENYKSKLEAIIENL